MRTRNWSIRSKIIALVAVPLTALLALWIFATSLTAGPAFNLLSAQTLLDTVGHPGEVLVGELQHERRLSVEFLSGADAAPYRRSWSPSAPATDRAIGRLPPLGRRATTRRTPPARPCGRGSGRSSPTWTRCPPTAAHIDGREVDVVGAQNMYNEIIDSGFAMFSATATFDDEQIDREVRGLTTVGRGQEYLSRTDSLLAGANAAGPVHRRRPRRVAAGDRHLPVPARRGRRPTCRPSDRTAYQQAEQRRGVQPAAQHAGHADQRRQPGRRAVPGGGRRSGSRRTTRRRSSCGPSRSTPPTSLADRATPVAVDRPGPARRRRSARPARADRLDHRVGAARPLDRRPAAPAARRGARDGRRAAAHRGAPAAARRGGRRRRRDAAAGVRQGRDRPGRAARSTRCSAPRCSPRSRRPSVRRGINEVFLNIARRSQTLLHRQLALLDRMERRETEPEELEDLFRVDHLATRMRRHAEDLVILAGAAPGRGWRNPVPADRRGPRRDQRGRGLQADRHPVRRDVRGARPGGRRRHPPARRAAGERRRRSRRRTPGSQVTGQVLPNGYALEIEDRGLGMSAGGARRGEPQAGSSRRTSTRRTAPGSACSWWPSWPHRHGIRVSLRSSAYGGITAIVLIPGELVTAGPGPLALPAGPSPADKSWDRPLVGTGNDDPSRHSLAALQWQGTEELRSITVPGRPVTLDGIAGPTAADGRRRGRPRRRPDRRRSVRPGRHRKRPAAARAARAGRRPARSPDGLTRGRPGATPPDRRRAVPAEPDGRPPGPPPARPDAVHRRTALPRRVRQASLAPQLRATGRPSPTDTPARCVRPSRCAT